MLVPTPTHPPPAKHPAPPLNPSAARMVGHCIFTSATTAEPSTTHQPPQCRYKTPSPTRPRPQRRARPGVTATEGTIRERPPQHCKDWATCQPHTLTPKGAPAKTPTRRPAPSPGSNPRQHTANGDVDRPVWVIRFGGIDRLGCT
ncbi:hypothetical protein CRENBAI_011524 [Crenichthys baileyi]|uniref:Uncharacterized protein n=1 Tax=Crenichthys baileyi TaxID=28760 RepID=A0AAV9R3A7_9TELE